MIDLCEATFSINEYGGSEKKLSMMYAGRKYMVKFPDPIREKKNDLSYMNNAFSEDIGSKIFKSLGIPTQNTFLGSVVDAKGNEKIVVACEDFTQDGASLAEFSKMITGDIEEDFHISKGSIPIEAVSALIDRTPYIQNKTKLKEQFWDMFVGDTLLGNTDRHFDNFGFLKHDGIVEFAPIYDCGSTLSPLKSERAMITALRLFL